MGVVAEMTGAKIIGGNGERVPDDFYATPPEAVRALLRHHAFAMQNILEPCVGEGHIAKVLTEMISRRTRMTCVDAVDRGYPGTIQADFLSWGRDRPSATPCQDPPDPDPPKYDTIITNPPYKLAEQFIIKCMDLLMDGGQLAMFLKIQFLEGTRRKALFDQYPPQYVYVFRRRISAWNGGMPTDPKTGKAWSGTITFAWYVWKKGIRTEPVIRWID